MSLKNMFIESSASVHTCAMKKFIDNYTCTFVSVYVIEVNHHLQSSTNYKYNTVNALLTSGIVRK